MFRSRKRDYLDNLLELEAENLFHLEKQVYVESFQKII